MDKLIILLLLLLLLYIVFLFKETLVNDDFNIPVYHNSVKTFAGYNIGDILNMPSFHAGWNRNPHNNIFFYNNYKEAVEKFPNTIVYYYSTLRTDENEPIPNLNKIEEAIEIYKNNNLNNLNELINKVNKDNVLCIHLRSGDKGMVEDEYINKINILVDKFDEIIILCGIHADEAFNNINNSKHNLIKSLQKLNNKKIQVNIDIPDNHLIMMRYSKNLLVHKGGFSILAIIIFNGNNLYYTDFLEASQHGEIINHVNNKKINYIKI